ncbi:hypothetical protein RchiOBHm_Chr3g0481951 [Rosa chinensis]|uniref:Uncharacterized protein n=1 Tax=Rosa chinensis TaxID=74649 RepID=A0A2P6RE40_ROSCH|nr:hypothetical protein RchiOBHm_Chr3g0481951 [Rosa chinensis]
MVAPYFSGLLIGLCPFLCVQLFQKTKDVSLIGPLQWIISYRICLGIRMLS